LFLYYLDPRIVIFCSLPPNAIFQESIKLGRSSYERIEVNNIIKKLGDEFFTATSYHLVHRNCNHFTETFATALILGDQLAESDVKRLERYPQWINRLANTGQLVVTKDAENDTRTCMPMEEARKAVGAEKKVGWSLSKSINETSTNKSSGATKKELTEAQKAALAKIRHK
jgi:PPPDE putative peptidase domain